MPWTTPQQRSCNWLDEPPPDHETTENTFTCFGFVLSWQHPMAILIDKSTRLVVQGLTGREGTFHAKQAAAYGTAVVGGVTPGKGGTTHEGWPVFNTVAKCVQKTGA